MIIIMMMMITVVMKWQFLMLTWPVFHCQRIQVYNI